MITKKRKKKKSPLERKKFEVQIQVNEIKIIFTKRIFSREKLKLSRETNRKI